MSIPVSLTLSGGQHAHLKGSPLSQGRERSGGDRAVRPARRATAASGSLVHEVHPVPYEISARRPDGISWPVEWMNDLLDRAAA